MSVEREIADIMQADVTLMATLTGGVYTSAGVGRDGITRDTAPAAFDASGYLKPCALVRQRGAVPDGVLVEADGPAASAAQRVEIYLYEDNGYGNIDTALDRLLVLLLGRQLNSGSSPLEWVNTLDRERDEGALNSASMARQDWLVVAVHS